jgi:hypothetical protein
MNSANHEQGHPHKAIWFVGHCIDEILCLLQMASITNQINHVGTILHFCRNAINQPYGFKVEQAFMKKASID